MNGNLRMIRLHADVSVSSIGESFTASSGRDQLLPDRVVVKFFGDTVDTLSLRFDAKSARALASVLLERAAELEDGVTS